MAGLLQRLPARAARLCLSVEQFLLRDLALPHPEGGFVLGVSGGADSTALLIFMCALAERWHAPLQAVHMDHGLRPESAAEALHVQALCQRWQVPCTLVRENVRQLAAEQGMGVEDAGRTARYRAFEQVRQHCGAQWIATGHHSGDLEEDVLLRLLRGAGWPALGGMPAVDAARHVTRPLLMTAPEDLRQMLREMREDWLEDASNASRDFRRNRLRHDVLPLLRQENPALRHGICELWRQARADERHWAELLRTALLCHPLRREGVLRIADKALLAGLDAALRPRLFRQIVQECGGQARAATLHALDAAWCAGRGGARFQFPGGVTAQTHKGSVRFSPAP